MKYARFLESEVQLTTELTSQWDEVVVVPVYGENELIWSFLNSLDQASKNLHVLSILVVNARVDSPSDIVLENKLILKKLNGLQKYSPSLDLLVIDRTIERPFPVDEGVGLARKIGCDIAWKLYEERKIKSSFIHTTDADVLLPNDYFNLNELDENHFGIGECETGVILHPFIHVGDATHLTYLAHRCYEAFLESYVQGLRGAHSPYAFHTIGSTLSFRASLYPTAFGFPKRMAAEDFYFLNKMAKLGKIRLKGGSPLHIQMRESLRVPFGTGVSCHKIRKNLESGNDVHIYDPKIFHVLNIFLTSLNGFSSHRDESLFFEDIRIGFLDNDFIKHEDAFLNHLKKINISFYLKAAAKNTRTKEHLLFYLHTWFDAFKTLKTMHALRDLCFPMIKFDPGDLPPIMGPIVGS